MTILLSELEFLENRKKVESKLYSKRKLAIKEKYDSLAKATINEFISEFPNPKNRNFIKTYKVASPLIEELFDNYLEAISDEEKQEVLNNYKGPRTLIEVDYVLNNQTKNNVQKTLSQVRIKDEMHDVTSYKRHLTTSSITFASLVTGGYLMGDGLVNLNPAELVLGVPMFYAGIKFSELNDKNKEIANNMTQVMVHAKRLDLMLSKYL